jgi:hypothetical protein
MASKLRYGPRFGQGPVDSRYGFDQRINNDMLHHTHHEPGSLGAVVNTIRAQNTIREKRRRRGVAEAPALAEHEAIQERCRDRVVQILKLVEFTLDELREAAGLGVRGTVLVNQMMLFEASAKLKKAAHIVETWNGPSPKEEHDG